MSAILDARKSVVSSKSTTVRLFEDGDQEFVMKAELFHAIHREHYEESDEEFVATMSYKQALETCGDRVERVEFIRTPIIRSEHKAEPIRRPFQDDFGILAADAFFEMMNTFIIGAKLFQKKAEWEDFEELFELLEDIFKAGEENLYFLKITSIDMVTSSFMVDASKKCKSVRAVEKGGFTVQNLKNELAHLNLTKTFPEIQNHAEVVYSEVDKRKKEEILRTCDLVDAIEHCQLICVLSRLSNLQKFLHNQKGCRRVYGYTCKCCESGSLEGSEDLSDVNNESEAQKTLEVESQKTSECTACELLKSSISQLESKHLRQEEKCKKTQMHLDEKLSRLRQELKEEKKKTLELQNQKTSDEKEILEKNREIQELREGNENMWELQNQMASDQTEFEAMILEKNREIEKLKEAEIRMKAENEVNQRLIQQLMDKLASSGVKKNSEVPTSSSRIQECQICFNETNDGETVRCQKCRHPFHKNCASKWLDMYLHCPSCEEEFRDSTTSSVSSFP